MKIILANLPWKSFGKTGVRAGSRWPHLKGPTEKDYLPFPFFLAYAAALLKQNNFDVELVDAIAEKKSYGTFFRQIRKINPQLLVCETSTVSLIHDMGILEKIGKDIPIAICGPDITIRQPAFLKKYPFIKYVLVGEYEFTLLDLVTNLKANNSLNDVAGLIYRDAGGIRITSLRALVDLNKMPWPLREGLPMERYNDTPGDMPLPSVQMLASRGCPYRCKFCLWPQVMYQSNQYRTRDVKDIVDEMEYLVKKMHFKSVYFDDDTFNCGRERMFSLCDEIKRRSLNVPWGIMARADLMDEEILVAMRQAGLYAIKYGVESASQELIDKAGKNMNLKKTEEIIRLTKMLGIKSHLTFTFGLPGETKESIYKTVELALRLDPATIQFSIATPFPGTVFFKEMKESGYIISDDLAEYDGNNKSVITYPRLSEKNLAFAIRYAYKEWALHCAKRAPKKSGYFLLLKKNLKKHGLLITAVKIIRFLIRTVFVLSQEGVWRKRNLASQVKISGLNVGRLSLLFENGNLSLFWEGRKLTRGRGFANCFEFDNGERIEPAQGYWDCQKLSDSELLLRRNNKFLDEVWKIKILDEKQIDWDIEVALKNGTKAFVSKTMLILSTRYHTWIDSWGEGRFDPGGQTTRVELKNPYTPFIGLRGRKKIKGQLPTCLLDVSGLKGEYAPAIKNSETKLGGRVLEVKSRFLNGKSSFNQNNLFSVKIKIVEEDFRKRKLAHYK
ncbi:MAG: radical SAM protein [Candidatus Omnitrophica bacterium]|nr:radical SAM protein [Candidatus Omnitrophota bacterium]